MSYYASIYLYISIYIRLIEVKLIIFDIHSLGKFCRALYAWAFNLINSKLKILNSSRVSKASLIIALTARKPHNENDKKINWKIA